MLRVNESRVKLVTDDRSSTTSMAESSPSLEDARASSPPLANGRTNGYTRHVASLSTDGADDEPAVTLRVFNGSAAKAGSMKRRKACDIAWLGAVLWLKRTCLERTLLLAIIALCLLFTLYLCLVRERVVGVCTTAACVQAAHNLISSIDQSVDPCDNFYEYACKRWTDEHPIPDDQMNYGTFQEVRDRVDNQMRVLLADSVVADDAPRALHLTKLWYDKCMNETAINLQGSAPMLALIARMGPWPILQHADYAMADGWSVTDTIAAAAHYTTMPTLYSAGVHADAKNTSRAMLNIDQAELILGRGSRDYYMNDTYAPQMHALKMYMHDVTRIFIVDLNVTVNETRLWLDIDDMMRFEMQMANITVREQDRRDPIQQYHLMSLSALNELTPTINWTELLVAQSPANMSQYWRPDTEVNVAEPTYVAELESLLKATEPATVVNYIVWRLVNVAAKSLDSRFARAKQEFFRKMFGQTREPQRWKECVTKTTHMLTHAAGALYVRKHFNPSDKDAALVMIAHLRDAFVDIVSTLDWMDLETQHLAVLKAKGIRNHIGYPDFILNNTALDQHYEHLQVTESNTYFEVFQAYVNWVRSEEFGKLDKPYNKDFFEISPAEVNAFYSPEKNAITFPAGILQPPFFNRGYPKSVNYGAIGAVIGHEITHGFDDQGSHFNADGNLINWWGKQARDGFQKRTNCMIAQYSAYEMPVINMNVDGVLTQGENIADNGGVKEAFSAYRAYVRELGHEEDALPGITEFTHNQLFFLSYAHFWCSKKLPGYAVGQILRDEHAPERFRVIGVLSNMAEFAEEFKCAEGTRMNPFKTDKSKCVVW